MSILEMKNIYKSFNGVPVLTDVSLSIGSGEVHALLGENGAGKSTLMNILTGVLNADSGKVIFEGQEIKNNSVIKSEALGIGFVHQELNMVNDLRVYENIFLCKELVTKFGRLKKKEMVKKSAELFKSLGVDIDPVVYVDTLNPSEKQLLEICKSLFFDAKLLILDEPTTALNNEEISRLFQIIRRLKKTGKSFILISHKMPEIFEIADNYTVLRNGKFIKSGVISETNPEEVTKQMVGDTYSSESRYEARDLGETVLEVENYSGDGFEQVNLSVRRGEIVALTGLQGAGGSEFMKTVFGILPSTSGNVTVFGKKVTKNSIQKSMKRRMGFLPGNRKENAVIPDMTILENMIVSEHVLTARRPHIMWKKERQRYAAQKSTLNIKAASENNLLVSLSGGNQQKVLFARWLNTDADILLLENPTQGIDVGAKEEIYRLLLKLAEEGNTIIFNTLEIPEIKRVADRCIIFYNGSIIKTLKNEEVDEHTVMMYATNAINAEEAHT